VTLFRVPFTLLVGVFTRLITFFEFLIIRRNVPFVLLFRIDGVCSPYRECMTLSRMMWCRLKQPLKKLKTSSSVSRRPGHFGKIGMFKCSGVLGQAGTHPTCAFAFSSSNFPCNSLTPIGQLGGGRGAEEEELDELDELDELEELEELEQGGKAP
jgi:hypothetical protein